MFFFSEMSDNHHYTFVAKVKCEAFFIDALNILALYIISMKYYKFLIFFTTNSNFNFTKYK